MSHSLLQVRRWFRGVGVAMLVLEFGLVPRHAQAQHGGGGAPTALVPPAEAAQFGFLVGQWEVTAKPKATTLAQRLHGVKAVTGTWKAWRALDGWGLEDELRLTDASGNPLLLTHTMRYYDRGARRWTNAAIDVYKGVSAQSTAVWRDAEMTISGRGTDDAGRAFLSRATFSRITASSFSYRLDRSFDAGKTWTDGVTIISATRVAATAPR